jgi:hypothetical protein
MRNTGEFGQKEAEHGRTSRLQKTTTIYGIIPELDLARNWLFPLSQANGAISVYFNVERIVSVPRLSRNQDQTSRPDSHHRSCQQSAEFGAAGPSPHPELAGALIQIQCPMMRSRPGGRRRSTAGPRVCNRTRDAASGKLVDISQKSRSSSVANCAMRIAENMILRQDDKKSVANCLAGVAC